MMSTQSTARRARRNTLPPRLTSAAALATTPFAALGCAGTEADNPFVERPADVTSCKSHEDYVALPSEPAQATSDVAPRFRELQQALTTSSEVPVWLECIDWALGEDGELALTVFNFRGPCGVQWSGHSFVTDDGALRIEVENGNDGCAVAGCGNCIYDTRATFRLETEALATTPFTLARLPCNGENGQDSDWKLPLAAEATGTRCVPSDGWGAASAAYADVGRDDTLFAPCTAEAAWDPEYLPPVDDCGEGFSCTTDRCLATCATDADCPLQGAFECRQGVCQLSE